MDLWDDPPESVRREFKHGPWAGMPSRFEWNNSPNHAHSQTCIECGYRWGHTDFTYRAHPSRPVETHHICWNCWMIDNQPDSVGRFWGLVDSAKSSPKAKDQGGFKMIGQ